MIRALALVLLAPPALAEPAYLDDRSDPAALVRSYYNAVSRQEYARAWSYYAEPKPASGYDAFAAGYADTATAEVETGEVTSEGAAGSIYSSVPALVTATASDGATRRFAGCYTIVQVQPAVQEPPFRPLEIREARLAPTEDSAPPASCP